MDFDQMLYTQIDIDRSRLKLKMGHFSFVFNRVMALD